MLAHLDESVGNSSWLANTSHVCCFRVETTHVKRRLVGIASDTGLARIIHWWHLHVLLLAKAHDFAFGRDVQLDFLSFLYARQ